MDFEEYEVRIEEQENDIEQFENEKQENVNRMEHLQKAISVLEGDNVLSSLIEMNKEELVLKNQAIQEKIEERKAVVYDIERAIVFEAEENAAQRSILEELSEMGENVSEAWEIVEERRQLISECSERLRQLAERLGIELTELGEEPGGTYGSKHLVKTYGEGSVKKK